MNLRALDDDDVSPSIVKSIDGLRADHYAQLAEGSGIPHGLILQRGYRTVTKKIELESLGFRGDGIIVPTLLMPMWGVDGTICGYQHKPDVPRKIDERLLKYESLPGKSPRIDVSPGCIDLLADPETPLWITEGIKKGDSSAARGLCCIALAGVWTWRNRLVELSDWDRIAIKGRIIYLAFDSDVSVKPGVRHALRRLAKMLMRRGAKEIRPVLIPTHGAEKAGLDDFFAAGGTISELTSSVSRDLLESQGIVVNNRNLADISDDALDSLVESNVPPRLFVRTGELVRVTLDERAIPKIAKLTTSSLRGILARAGSYVRLEKKGSTEVAPPLEIVEDLLSLPGWPMPSIVAVTRAPVLSADGLFSSPGYDPGSQFYVALKETVPAWEGDAKSAAKWLAQEILSDFPFDSDASFANALALMLLPIVRPAIDGPTPLHLIDAPSPGTGKSLLARILLMATCGPEISPTPGTRDEEEWRKKISSSLLGGRPYIFLDNLDRKVDSASLAAALAATEWEDRRLGATENILVPIRCAWAATSNNAELSIDIVRRSAWIRLDAKVELPHTREGFKHPNIERFVANHRMRVVSALCRIVQEWVDAGRPAGSTKPLGSFEAWTEAMSGLLEGAGVPGLLDNKDDLRAAAAGGDEAAWREFYESWWLQNREAPVPASALMQTFIDNEGLAGMLGDRGEHGRNSRLGHILKRRQGIVVDGLHIECEHTSRTMYRLRGEHQPRKDSAQSPRVRHLSTPTNSEQEFDL